MRPSPFRRASGYHRSPVQARGPVTVVTERFEDLVSRGLRAFLAEDDNVELVAADISHDELPEALRRRLVLDRLPPELPKAYGDRDSLATILTELATNADKYSPPDTAVELSAEADDQTVTFRVADRGIGVPPEHAERAFERYWQGRSGERVVSGSTGGAGAGSSMVRGHLPGAGLGLYLVRRVVERQHGWVSLRAREGGGTVAEVRLPRA